MILCDKIINKNCKSNLTIYHIFTYSDNEKRNCRKCSTEDNGLEAKNPLLRNELAKKENAKEILVENPKLTKKPKPLELNLDMIPSLVNIQKDKNVSLFLKSKNMQDTESRFKILV